MILKKIIQGDSLSIGFRFNPEYDITRIENAYVYLDGNLVASSFVDSILRVELTSAMTTAYYGVVKLYLAIDDELFGIRKSQIGELTFVQWTDTINDESINTGYSLIVGVTVSETATTSDTLLYEAIKVPSVISRTYAELAAMITAKTLVQGQKYLLSDHITTYIQPITLLEMTADEAEPLLLTASSDCTFEPIAFSALYPDDAIYYSFNLPTVFANDGFTKGIILRRDIPSRNVSIPMDWRHIKYRRWKYNVTTVWASGNNYAKGDIVTDSTSTYIYIAPYDITNSTDIDELIRYPHKTTDYGSYLSTGQPICVGSVTLNFTVPVDSNNYIDYPSIIDSSSVNGSFFNIQIGTLLYKTPPIIRGLKSYNTVFKCLSCNNIYINMAYFSTIGDPLTHLGDINFDQINTSVIGTMTSSAGGSFSRGTIGFIIYSHLGTYTTGILMGHYKTISNVNSEQCQGIEISDHSYGCIIGNGASGIRIAFKSKYNVIGQNVTNVKIGSYTNNAIIPKNTTNWDIGDGIEMTGKTLPTIINDSYYSKTVRKANTAIVVKYDDETGATITTII